MNTPQNPDETFDVAILGGSFAGVSAALYLARGRRRVVMFDHGLTRNRFAAHGHSFFGQDHRSPDEIRLAGQADLARYDSVTVAEARVDAITRAGDLFHLVGSHGVTRARRLILAHGMRDILPDLPGLQACWGHTAIQCPYCHGFELADRPTGVLVSGPGALHQARMLADWTSDLTVFSDGHDLTREDRANLMRWNVKLVEAKVVSLQHTAGVIEAVVLEDGRHIACQALYLAPPNEPSAPFAADLGCAFEQGPQGLFVLVDAMQATSVPAVWAAGDLCRPMFGAVFAAADGARAGVAAHQSLMRT